MRRNEDIISIQLYRLYYRQLYTPNEDINSIQLCGPNEDTKLYNCIYCIDQMKIQSYTIVYIV